MSKNASTAVIRHWAREQGLLVGDRGRLSPDVLAAYADRAAGAANEAAGTATATAYTPTETTAAASAVPRDGYRVAASPVPGATGISRRVRAAAF